MAFPRLTFFCSLPTPELEEMLQPGVLADLRRLSARVSLGTLDFSPQRAALARRLSEGGVPLVGWLLPAEAGRRYCLEDARQAYDRYLEFRSWTQDHRLTWQGVGLELIPDVGDLQDFGRRGWRSILRLARRMANRQALRSAERIFDDLCALIHAAGYAVESYILPVLVDERLAGSTLVRRLGRLASLPADKEVLLLLSSALPGEGVGLVGSYAPRAQAVALGSAGGSPLDGLETPALGWSALRRDLSLAWAFCDDLYISSLEGCVRRGFLSQITATAFDQPLFSPDESVARLDAWRAYSRALLWFNAHSGALAATWALGVLTLRVIHRAARRAPALRPPGSDYGFNRARPASVTL